MLTVLFDGVASGALLFLLAIGLSITLGIMNFVNLAHGAFAMLGGYVTVVMLNRWGIPFLYCLPVAFIVPALAGVILERGLYSRLYDASGLDQVLFTIGIVFASMAMASYFMGSQHQIIQVPSFLQGQWHLFSGFDVGIYRLFLLAFCGVITLLLHLALMRTRFGSRLRAAVDNGRIARGLGINVNRLFAITFGVGSGLAGLAGALGIEILNLDPVFPVKFLVYFLIVVAVGGAGTVGGPLAAALILGIFDVAGKYYVSQIGAFVIYAVMVIMLIWRPQGLFGRKAVR
ncbi:MAG: branched-chain amino acid ABC transporter permease [Syntrophorhabdales bacterium]|jgi:branched-chain amino acid transport system permease protein